MSIKNIGIVDYGAGNIFSLRAALTRQGITHGMITQAADFDQYERIIIPGVGHAGAAMDKLEKSGMVSAIINCQKPVLGICLGMQLLTSQSEEAPDTPLLGIIPLQTCRFNDRISLKVPHMGWDRVHFEQPHPLFENIDNNSYFYFVHSFYIEYNSIFTPAICDYGIRFSAIISKANFWGVQFHPEKSGKVGEQLLVNFSNFRNQI